MGTGAITEYIDVAQLALYIFWIFFFFLVPFLLDSILTGPRVATFSSSEPSLNPVSADQHGQGAPARADAPGTQGRRAPGRSGC